jgi:uncharacterized membrane protein YgcG
MDNVFEPMDRGSLEVIRRLEAFADARLEPTVAATSRMRAAVMVAAHRQAAVRAADAAGAVPLAMPAPARSLRPSWLDAVAWRRPAAAIFAGCLTLALLAGTAVAVRPGGLLYPARVWTEAANLPAAADQLARAEAEIQRLGARLDEAEAAAAAGDGPATVAAVEAYATIVTEAAAGTAGDPAAEDALQLTIERHVAILSQLAATVPGPVRAAIDHALASSTLALDEMDRPPAGGNNGNGPATNNGNGADGNNGDGGSGGGAAGAGGAGGTGGGNGAAGGGEKPDAAPTPAPTPKAPKPSPTGHERTPRPTSTHEPPGQQADPSDPPGQDHQ